MVFSNSYIICFGISYTSGTRTIQYPMAFTTIPKPVASLHWDKPNTQLISLGYSEKTSFRIYTNVSGNTYVSWISCGY